MTCAACSRAARGPRAQSGTRLRASPPARKRCAEASRWGGGSSSASSSTGWSSWWRPAKGSRASDCAPVAARTLKPSLVAGSPRRGAPTCRCRLSAKHERASVLGDAVHELVDRPQLGLAPDQRLDRRHVSGLSSARREGERYGCQVRSSHLTEATGGRGVVASTPLGATRGRAESQVFGGRTCPPPSKAPSRSAPSTSTFPKRRSLTCAPHRGDALADKELVEDRSQGVQLATTQENPATGRPSTTGARRGQAQRLAAVHDRDRRRGHPLHPRPLGA